MPSKHKEETKTIGQPFRVRIGKLGDQSLCGPGKSSVVTVHF